MRKISAITTLLSFAFICIFCGGKSTNNNNNMIAEVALPSHFLVSSITIHDYCDDTIQSFSCDVSEEITYSEEVDLTETKISEAQERIASLDTSNKKEWFIEYKSIQGEYSDWIDCDETIYDYFTSEELSLLFKIVEAEVTGQYYFQSKVNVAFVIFNRLDSEEFPNSLTDVLTQKSQFSSYWDKRYSQVEVTETTILACEYAWMFPDETDGSLYFDSCKKKSWARRNREYLFTDDVGHAFYR